MRTTTVTESVPAPEAGRGALLTLGALLLAYVGLLVAALIPAAAVFAAWVAPTIAAEVAAARRAPFPVWALGRLQVGAPFRALVAGLALLVLGARSGIDPGSLTVAAGSLLALHLLRLATSGLAELVTRQRRMPILLRGLDHRVRIPPAPRPWVLKGRAELLSAPLLVPILVAGFAFAAGGAALLPLLIAGLAVSAAPLAVAVVMLASAALAMRRLPRRRWQQAAAQALVGSAPRVVLYHAGGPHTLYQVQSWLATLERLTDPYDEAIGTPLVLLRDPETFARIGPTSLPVACVQPSTLLMGMDLPSLRLVLYTSHATGNMHMLRRTGVRHAFVGHGDSDKPVTVNPFLRAYTELWVAGPAAADRFERAGLMDKSLAEHRILQVGRPQLDPLRGAAESSLDEADAASPAPVTGTMTVLYAPTWEGFEDEPHQTSVGELGLELVRAMLSRGDVRVLYRPHPMTGVRDLAVRAAHHEIVRLLGTATTERATTDAGRDGARGSVDPSRGDPAVSDPLRLAARPAAEFGGRIEADAAREAWTADRLVQPGHRVVPGPAYDLSACFRAADALLCDVSSLITEFLATGKPYGVTDPAGRPADEFALRCPSVKGGFLVGGADALDPLCLAVRSPEENDPAAGDRAWLAERLLGPRPALDRFREAAR